MLDLGHLSGNRFLRSSSADTCLNPLMDFFLQVIAGTFVFSLGLFQLVLPLAFHFFLGKTGSQGDSTTLDREKLYINEVRLPQIFVF